MKKIKNLLIFSMVAVLFFSCTKEIEELMLEKTNTAETAAGCNNDSIKNDTVSVDTIIADPIKIDPIIVDTIHGNTDSTIFQSPFNITGTGSIISKTIEASNFTEVETKKFGMVEIKYGAEYKVEVSDYQNIIENVKVFMQGERLIISYAENVSVMGSKLKIAITMPNKLSQAIVSGSGSINIISGFAPNNISLVLSGAGSISATRVVSENVKLVLSGAGTIEAKGTVNKLTIEASGSGTIQCKDLVCKDADCGLSGQGIVFLSVTNNLKLKALGVGSLTYYGSPVLDVDKGFLFSLVKG